MWYEQGTYTISEQEDNVELCVTSVSPGIEEMFTINITTDSIESTEFFTYKLFCLKILFKQIQLFSCKTITVFISMLPMFIHRVNVTMSQSTSMLIIYVVISTAVK